MSGPLKEDFTSSSLSAERPGRAFVQLLERDDMAATSGLLEALLEAVPYGIHTALTDNGMRVHRVSPQAGASRRPDSGATHSTASAGAAASTTGSPNPTAPGPMGSERMNCTIRDVAVGRCRYETHNQIYKHPNAFILAAT